MLADIITGEHAAADVLFLIAFFLFLIAAIWVAVVARKVTETVLAYAGLAVLALGWLVL